VIPDQSRAGKRAHDLYRYGALISIFNDFNIDNLTYLIKPVKRKISTYSTCCEIVKDGGENTMEMLESVYPVGIAGIAMFLAGISLVGLSGKILLIIDYLFQPLHQNILRQTKTYLRYYSISFTLILVGGITLAVVAAIMLIAIFQMSLLG